MDLKELLAKAEAANNAIPGPWHQSTRNWRNEQAAPNRYITGNHCEPEDDDDDCGSCVSVAVVPGNATSGDIPRVIAEYLEAACPFNLLGILERETYTIKPLEWRDTEVASHADTLFGRVWAGDTSWWKGSFQMTFCESRDHGKELAWAWYKAKLGEALTRVGQ